ncbi:hypothetical protein SVIO_095560 [Streptomyces violaceusniger]|uniref:Acyl-CoA dehydrogenase/oxidase N-terminal domain-containing protein n=1 Tax=Streptomyces violaceusniger TaxID=68280 RepID=A0A4D4LLJ7_STRVO|nr:hypothetical protein SVIO_095560 [Streptomyces violaceusniger]
MSADTTATAMTETELAAFAESVRGTLDRHWPDPPAAAGAELADLWSAAAEQGWLGLGADGALAAAVAAVRELGRVACPLPVLDAYAAALLFAPDDGIVHRITTGEMRITATVPGEEATRAHHLDAARQATHLLAVPPGAGHARLHPLREVRDTPDSPSPPGPRPPSATPSRPSRSMPRRRTRPWPCCASNSPCALWPRPGGPTRWPSNTPRSAVSSAG